MAHRLMQIPILERVAGLVAPSEIPRVLDSALERTASCVSPGRPINLAEREGFAVWDADGRVAPDTKISNAIRPKGPATRTHVSGLYPGTEP